MVANSSLYYAQHRRLQTQPYCDAHYGHCLTSNGARWLATPTLSWRVFASGTPPLGSGEMVSVSTNFNALTFTCIPHMKEYPLALVCHRGRGPASGMSWSTCPLTPPQGCILIFAVQVFIMLNINSNSFFLQLVNESIDCPTFCLRYQRRLTL
jgi:hypothetical protein